MKRYILASLLMTVNYIMAQEKLYVNAPSIAFKDTELTVEAGVFLDGSTIASYEETDKYYKIYRDYVPPVYVEKSNNIQLTYNSKRIPSPAPIIDKDEYLNGPHLYTVVAGLKVREYPQQTAKVLGTVLNGTPIVLSYFPKDENEYVEINYLGEKGFIPASFIGNRPNLDQLISQYNAVNTTDEQKKYAERILELAWNSSTKDIIKALEIFIEYAETNELTSLANQSKLLLEMHKAIPKKGETKIVEKLYKNKDFGFVIQGAIEPQEGFDKEFVHATIGYSLDSFDDLEDCTLGDYESLSNFNSAVFIVNDYNEKHKVRELSMINANQFKINHSLLNENTSEGDFLQIGKGLITSYNPVEQTYLIERIGMSYKFQFKNNKLFKVESFISC